MKSVWYRKKSEWKRIKEKDKQGKKEMKKYFNLKMKSQKLKRKKKLTTPSRICPRLFSTLTGGERGVLQRRRTAWRVLSSFNGGGRVENSGKIEESYRSYENNYAYLWNEIPRLIFFEGSSIPQKKKSIDIYQMEKKNWSISKI